MSVENNETKTARVPTFDGDESNYQMWWVRFKAYAKVSGFEKALNIIAEPDLSTSQVDAEVLVGTNVETKTRLVAVKRNDTIMENLTLVFATNELLNAILSIQTAELPEGLACLVIKDLANKHEPTDAMCLADERMALSAVTMRDNEDPKKLFERLKVVEVRYNMPTHKTKEEDKMAVILS